MLFWHVNSQSAGKIPARAYKMTMPILLHDTVGLELGEDMADLEGPLTGDFYSACLP
jgi:hypothetical protein